MYLPNRLELSFLLVLALPNAYSETTQCNHMLAETQYSKDLLTKLMYLKDWVGLDEPVLDPVHFTSVATAQRQILQHVLGGLWFEEDKRGSMIIITMLYSYPV